jgi:hypothetical protein
MLAAIKDGNNYSTVVMDAGNAYSTWIPLHAKEIHGHK